MNNPGALHVQQTTKQDKKKAGNWTRTRPETPRVRLFPEAWALLEPVQPALEPQHAA